jgi:hypothetical protein
MCVKYLYFDNFPLHLLVLLLKAMYENKQTGMLVGPQDTDDLALLDVFMATSFLVISPDYSTSYFNIRPTLLSLFVDRRVPAHS